MSSWRSGRVSSWIAWSTLPMTTEHADDQRRATPAAPRRAASDCAAGAWAAVPGVHPRQLPSSADSARSRSSSEPSLSITCSARAAFSSWVELARLALVDQGVAAGRGALAAHARRRRRWRRWCRRRPPSPASKSSGTSTTATSVSAGSEASQAPIRSPTSGWICDSSQVSCSGSAKTISPIAGAVDACRRAPPPRPQRSTSAAAAAVGFEQLVDDRVAGERRRARAARRRPGPRTCPPRSRR